MLKDTISVYTYKWNSAILCGTKIEGFILGSMSQMENSISVVHDAAISFYSKSYVSVDDDFWIVVQLNTNHMWCQPVTQQN